MTGYVYILENAAMPDFVKIGMTNRTVSERVAELNRSTSTATPFKVVSVYSIQGDSRSVEKYIHDKFANKRLNKGREFFHKSVLSNLEKTINNAPKSAHHITRMVS